MNHTKKTFAEEHAFLTGTIAAIRSDISQPEALNDRINNMRRNIDNLQKNLADALARREQLPDLLAQYEAKLAALKPVHVDPKIAKLMKLKEMIRGLELEIESSLEDS